MNAVCPLVTKVHHEAKVRAGKGFTVLYVGHAGHDEAVGTLAVAPDAIRLVEHADDLDAVLADGRRSPKVAMLAQTTLALHEWEGIMDRRARAVPRAVDGDPQRPLLRDHQPPGRADGHRHARRRGRGDRQRQLVEHHRAREGGTRRRLPVVLRVDGPDELDVDELGRRRVVGVTAGASAPEELVEAVIAEARTRADGVEPVT